jgi:hypothetical protein
MVHNLELDFDQILFLFGILPVRLMMCPNSCREGEGSLLASLNCDHFAYYFYQLMKNYEYKEDDYESLFKIFKIKRIE